jgi:translation initiation factor 1
MTGPGSNSRLVYSTEGGRVPVRPASRAAAAPTAPSSSPDDGVIRIQRDRKGRGGKTATTVTGLPGNEAALDALLRSLKQYCGAGGSREGRTLVLQGDQRERLLERLTTLGHRAKLAGG